MKISVSTAAEADLLHETERYASLGLPDVGIRFQNAVIAALDRIAAMPLAGAPKVVKDTRLAGLRAWPVKGFDQFRIYYLIDSEVLFIIRILHGKRDIARILGEPG